MRETRKVDIGDAVLESVTRGTGDPVVLLPAPYHIDYLADFAKRLAEAGFRTVVVNWRGIGESKGPLEGINLHHLAARKCNTVGCCSNAPAGPGRDAVGGWDAWRTRWPIHVIN